MVISDVKPLISNGYIVPPEKPGIGLDINEEVVKNTW